MKCLKIFWFVVLLGLCWPLAEVKAAAQLDQPALTRACEVRISAKFRQWRIAPVSSDVKEFAKRLNQNPTAVFGDFDGDGRKDAALLIMEGPDGPDANPDYPRRLEVLHIAVCMNTSSDVKLYVIDKLYCGDGIALSKKGARYHDFETETEGTYKLDGVQAYCFEKAGATYEFENGAFRRIVDSD